MSTPIDPHLDELRALRTRAYGPDADIHEDAAALARLRELEAHSIGAGGDASTQPQAVEPRVKPTAIAEPAPVDAENRSAESGTEAFTIDAPRAAVDPPVWWRRRVPVLWTAAAVMAGVVLGIGSMVLLQSAAPDQVAVLHADADAEWPNQMFGVNPEDGHRYNEFHGLTVVTYDRSAGEGRSQPCLAVLTTPDGTGFAAGGCGAGAFPATVAIQITSLLPQALRDEFPEGASLQFVHDGTQVAVYAAQPIAARPTP